MQIDAIHHLKFAVADLDRQAVFAHDFGLITAERTDERLVLRTRGGPQQDRARHDSTNRVLSKQMHLKANGCRLAMCQLLKLAQDCDSEPGVSRSMRLKSGWVHLL
ncbi:hypothetical protein [Alteraurantiacibacter aestuarii]|uniref:hypothetical protein n=1 Tax=Alteraurantiacibacter aestuarii TaxID=650004 RepID=UPI0031DC42C7